MVWWKNTDHKQKIMHELSMVEGLIKILDKEQRINDIKKIKKINLSIGVLKTIVPESLIFFFESISKGTRYENAKLHIKTIPLQIYCSKCDKGFEFGNTYDFGFSCKKCGNIDVEVKSGTELCIDSVEGE